MAMTIDLQQLADILALAEQANIDVLELRQGDTQIRIVCHAHETTASNAATAPTHDIHAPRPPHAQPKPVQTANPSPQAANADPIATPSQPATNTAAAAPITSPMVGTFYRKSSPDHPPFIDVGQTVAVGDTLCIIEAMKIMHEVKAERAGTVRDILAKDGDMVEYDQPLIVLG